MMRAGVREEERTTISRFQSDLNLEIRDKVKLFPYRDLNELVQLCSKMEHQLKRKSFRKDSTPSYYKNFKKEGSSSKPYKSSLKAPSKESKSSDIEYFKCLGRGHIASQCPTKKTMILRGQDHYSSLDEAISSSSTSSSEDEAIDLEEEILPCSGDLLMVLKNTCSLIVDSGSSCNCCSIRLVEKLALTTIPHPRPYKLQWINEEGGIVVNQQANIPISIGKYKDEVLCDIVPLEDSHVFLGRPWKFDKKTIHDGLTNKISFQHLGRKIILCPLSPSQVSKDQIKMKAKREEEEKQRKQKQWKILWEKLGTKLVYSTNFHPQTDGQTEVVNRSLSTLLRVILKGNKKTWDECLPHIEFAYNRVVHKTTNLSPFEVVYGFNPFTRLDLISLPNTTSLYHEEGVSKAEFIRKYHEKVKSQIEKQTEKYAKYNNKRRKKVTFEIEDWV
uniref:Transposon Ty3-I Gag-Pol polyprotein n=1 Tax=Cajanus cajan TaxID=3821 RepID=A0A151UFU1_CAJCA